MAILFETLLFEKLLFENVVSVSVMKEDVESVSVSDSKIWFNSINYTIIVPGSIFRKIFSLRL